MSNPAPQSLIERFKNAPSSTRTGVIGGGVVLALAVVGIALTDGGQNTGNKPKVVEKQNVINSSARTSNTEELAGELSAAKKELSDQKAKLALIEERDRHRLEGTSVNGHLSELETLTAQVQILQERLGNIETGKAGAPVAAGQGGGTAAGRPGVMEDGVGRDGELVLGPDGKPLKASEGAGQTSGNRGTAGASGTAVQPQSTGPTIQIVTAEKKPLPEKSTKKSTPLAYVPSGSNFEAVLLNGMDASTAINANKSPTPALLRIKSEAILPNQFNFDVKECFVLTGGFGSMSTERVEMRTEIMSCLDQSGQVWEGKIEGYVVGEDGKTGARGRVVSKQGALLAKSFMAGFIGGLGSAFAPQPVQSLNLNTSGQMQDNYQYPSGSQVLGSGLSKGLNQSGTALANFYIQLAEQMFPVIELDAGRKMTIILLKGVELKMDKRV